MSNESQSARPRLRQVFWALFGVVLVVLLVLNANSTLVLKKKRDDYRVLREALENEKRKEIELAELETEHRQLEAEYTMMERGLHALYLMKCESPATLVPLWGDRIVSFQTSGKLPRQNARIDKSSILRNLSSTLRNLSCHETFFHVADTGAHKLKLEAFETIYKRARNNAFDFDTDPFYVQVFDLDAGKNYRMSLAGNGKRVFVKLSGHKEFPVDFPSGGNFEFSTGAAVQLPQRVISAPNQFAANMNDLTQQTALALAGFIEEGAGFVPTARTVVLKLTIESEGPLTAMPDDIHVVRKLLSAFEAGQDIDFKLNGDGLYEFPKE